MSAQVSLAITIDIQFPNGHATDDWTLPDAGADSFTAPVDIAWETDVNRYKPRCHFLCQCFANYLQRWPFRETRTTNESRQYPFTIKPADAASSAIFMV
jgi:hypothetical protein